MVLLLYFIYLKVFGHPEASKCEVIIDVDKQTMTILKVSFVELEKKDLPGASWMEFASLKDFYNAMEKCTIDFDCCIVVVLISFKIKKMFLLRLH